MNAFPDDPAVDGDPDAPDPNGAYEPILEDDPDPSLTMNPDAGDPLDDLTEGEDSDEPLDDDDPIVEMINEDKMDPNRHG